MVLKLIHRGPLQWHHFPIKSYENLPSGSEDIHRFFILDPSNAFRPFFCPTVNNLVAMIIAAHKQSKPIVEQGSPKKMS
jgi:hypothetical protein